MVAVYHRRIINRKRQSKDHLSRKKGGGPRCRPGMVKLIKDNSRALQLARLFVETERLTDRQAIANRISGVVHQVARFCEIRGAID